MVVRNWALSPNELRRLAAILETLEDSNDQFVNVEVPTGRIENMLFSREFKSVER